MDPKSYIAPELYKESTWKKVKNFFGKFKALASVVTMLLLVGGLVGGVYMTRQQTQTQQHAAAASDVIGYLDNRSNPSTWCGQITGWACDRSDPSKSIAVQLYAPDSYKAGVTHPIDTELANNTSSDEKAIAALCGQTSGNKNSYPHRFVVHIPDSLKNNTSMKIYVYGIGLDQKSNPLLVGSGISISCKAPTVSPSPSAGPTAGDINNDGVVNVVDYALLMNCYGNKFHTSSCVVGSSADMNTDGVVDGIDYNILLRALLGQ